MNNAIKKRSYSSYILIVLTMLSCTITQFNFTNEIVIYEPEKSACKEVWLNIFIHGIISIYPYLTVPNFFRFYYDKVENSVYAKTVELTRNDPFFYQNQTMQKPGLVPIDCSGVKPGYSAGALAYLFDLIFAIIIPDQQVENRYYTFGWSGLLSPSARYKDAKLLYQSLLQESARYQKQGYCPKIRLVSYSHGGNVVLNLPLVKKREGFDPSLYIDETWTFGMPVQIETDYCLNDSLFGLFIHNFSNHDRVQQLDFFSKNRFFSRRYFKERPGFKLPNKLIQVRWKITRRAGHQKPVTNLSLDWYKNGARPLSRNVSPGHTELWFFGWTAANYRKTLPLYPLPIVAIAPYALTLIKEKIHHYDPRNHLVLHLDTQNEKMVVHDSKTKKVFIYDDLFPNSTMTYLKEKIKQYQPPAYCREQANKKLSEATRDAHRIYHSQKKARKQSKKLSDKQLPEL